MIQAIETSYKGYRFRSRLEARWAVFFDTMGIEWEYEREGYTLNPVSFDGVDAFVKDHSQGVDSVKDLEIIRRIGERVEQESNRCLHYLPDFWLSEFQMWAEVKGNLKIEDADKIIRLSNQSGRMVLLLEEVGQPMSIIFPNDNPSSNKTPYIASSSFRRCPLCKCWALRQECNNPKGTCNCSKDPIVNYLCVHCLQEGKTHIRVKKAMEWTPVPPADELTRATQAARSARFEHGETPRVQRGRPRG